MGRGNPLIKRMNSDAHQNHMSASSGGQALATDPRQLNDLYNAPSATAAETQRATMNDVVVKCLILLGLVVVGGAVGWVVPAVGMIGALAGFALALVVIFKKKTSPGLIMAYAVCQGLFLGAISGLFEAMFDGIVLTAIISTLIVFVGMLALYAKAGVRIRGKVAAMVGIGLIAYMAFVIGNLIFGAFTGSSMRDVQVMGIPLGIIIGLVVVVLAALCLVMDFQEIDGALRAGVPEKESWRLAFGLMVTLIWLYVEILRLLSYFMSDD
ncbi:Bax inhibitor-1/YccA family protein [Rothia sp. AR01]|uniref:Bax inhibitor-1/YccA family protein n=1 Tax=Rothia santali TaxID=2949643 RepID=A0A9X2HKW2_9MICC|nr:Bax inhibitor-1/YccA family protein [Rothia santali]MCP3426798.1 Bax inhibitor-1/YccA family protein [Rothia santali]